MNTIQAHNVRVFRSEIPPEVHKTSDARRLKEACQQFESILFAQIWKKKMSNARAITGSDKERPWRQMEELAVEMASEELAKSGGFGLWKKLYDQMIVNVAAGMRQEVNEEDA